MSTEDTFQTDKILLVSNRKSVSLLVLEVRYLLGCLWVIIKKSESPESNIAIFRSTREDPVVADGSTFFGDLEVYDSILMAFKTCLIVEETSFLDGSLS